MNENVNLENMSHIVNTSEQFGRERERLRDELAELMTPINVLHSKLRSVDNNEYDRISKEIETLLTKDEGLLAKQIDALKEKIHKCNTEIMLRDRKDLIEQYLMVRSSVEDAYELLSELPENSKEAQELESQILELEEGLRTTITSMQMEGVGNKDAKSYNERYRVL